MKLQLIVCSNCGMINPSTITECCGVSCDEDRTIINDPKIELDLGEIRTEDKPTLLFNLKDLELDDLHVSKIEDLQSKYPNSLFSY